MVAAILLFSLSVVLDSGLSYLSTSAYRYSSAPMTNMRETSSSGLSGGCDENNTTSEILALPSSTSDVSAKSLKLGEKLKLDHIGPVVVNQDGTTSRISNWGGLSEAEKKKTWERISKRNTQRLEKLKAGDMKTSGKGE